MIRFERDPAGEASTTFWQWLQTHPDGYFINLTSSGRGLIHRGNCGHMKFTYPEQTNFLSREKLCAQDRMELERYAADKHFQLEDCTGCQVR